MFRALVAVLIVAGMAVQIDGVPARNLDESLPPPPASGVPCSMCSSCSNSCDSKPPPPPPPPKKPKKPYCPPPPPPFYYIIGAPPGQLYPLNLSFGNRNLVVEVPILVGCALLGLLMF